MEGMPDIKSYFQKAVVIMLALLMLWLVSKCT